jgi:hypothetical protein
MDKWGVDPEKVKLIEYNLLASQGVEFVIGRDEIENTKAYIAESIADMSRFWLMWGKMCLRMRKLFKKSRMNGFGRIVILGRFVTANF